MLISARCLQNARSPCGEHSLDRLFCTLKEAAEPKSRRAEEPPLRTICLDRATCIVARGMEGIVDCVALYLELEKGETKPRKMFHLQRYTAKGSHPRVGRSHTSHACFSLSRGWHARPTSERAEPTQAQQGPSSKTSSLPSAG